MCCLGEWCLPAHGQTVGQKERLNQLHFVMPGPTLAEMVGEPTELERTWNFKCGKVQLRQGVYTELITLRAFLHYN